MTSFKQIVHINYFNAIAFLFGTLLKFDSRFK